jgi:hypothetical protein
MLLPLDDAHNESILRRLLPGPDRKRQECAYSYRLIYRNTSPAPGCAMIWEVFGGRAAYQITLENAEDGRLQLHCTCADAVVRAEAEGRFCKHIRGLLQFGRALGESVDPLEPRFSIGA